MPIFFPNPFSLFSLFFLTLFILPLFMTSFYSLWFLNKHLSKEGTPPLYSPTSNDTTTTVDSMPSLNTTIPTTTSSTAIPCNREIREIKNKSKRYCPWWRTALWRLQCLNLTFQIVFIHRMCFIIISFTFSDWYLNYQTNFNKIWESRSWLWPEIKEKFLEASSMTW